MKMIPPKYRNTHSNAEKKIFEIIDNIELGEHYVCLHSLNISEHDYKQWAEIDFIIVLRWV